MCMKVEHITFLDSMNYLPFPLRKLPDAFGLTSRKSRYPHYFNTSENLNYVGSMPYISYYGVDAMSHSEREEFLECYEGQKTPRLMTNTCWNHIAKMTSPFCGKRARSSDVIF
jgi:hypothetical protein